MCRPDLRPVETARKTTVSITARFEAKNVTLITGLNHFNEASKLQLATNVCVFLIYLVADQSLDVWTSYASLLFFYFKDGKFRGYFRLKKICIWYLQ